MSATEYDDERFAYDDDHVDEWTREHARIAVEAEGAAREVFLATVKDAARRYGMAVRQADSSLINRYCRYTRAHSEQFDEAIEGFAEYVRSSCDEAIDGEILDHDKLRDLRRIAGEEE